MARTNFQSSLPAAAGDLTEEELAMLEREQTGNAPLADEPEEYDDPAIPERDYEAEAFQRGWRPIEQYKGRPGTWVDAKTFIDRGETFLPFVQKERDQLRGQLDGVTREMEQLRTQTAAAAAEHAADMQRLMAYVRRADQAGYDRAIMELKEQRRAAVASGDMQAFDDAEEKIDQATQERAKMAEEVPQRPQPTPCVATDAPQPVDPVIAQWMSENRWVSADLVLNRAMIGEHNIVIAEMPGMETRAQLELAKERVMTRYPNKFGIPDQRPQPERRQASATPRSAAPRGPAPAPRGGSLTIDSAITDPIDRAEARKGFTRARVSDPSITEAEYVTVFLDPHADVLAVMRANRTDKRGRQSNGK